MKGVIFNLLEEMIEDRLGEDVLEDIYSILPDVEELLPFVSPESYPDEHLFSILGVFAQHLQISLDQMLWAFGQDIFSRLAHKYPDLTRDISSPVALLSIMDRIHWVEVKKLFEDANPPSLLFERTADDAMSGILRYRSDRKLCQLVEGLLEGVADFYGCRVIYNHLSCMLKGHNECTYEVSFE
jgi:predicted hydrocarbon binding protein